MQTLSVEISQEQASGLKEAIERNPGWTKALVVRSLLNYLIGLSEQEQESLVKKHCDRKSEKQ